MKIAISGKGGVGKTTLAAVLSLLIAKKGEKILALDADPDANMASALGIPIEKQRQIIPIAQQAALIEERTGARVKQYGQIFKLNPEVADIADHYAILHRGVALLVLGGITQGGSGCACPENVLLRALVTDLVLHKNESLIMDMEAGIEHLGRATASGVDKLLIVVEPGQRAIDSTRRIVHLASEIGLKELYVVANKVATPKDEDFIKKAFPGLNIIGVIPYTEELRQSDREGFSALDGLSNDTITSFTSILNNLETGIIK